MISPKDLSYLRWADYGAQQFTTCQRRGYMAIIVAKDGKGRVLGTGVNGSPPGYPHCNEGHCPHADDPVGKHILPCIGIHAETNALMYTDFSAREGAAMYVNGVPCYDCAVKTSGSGIIRVCYMDDLSRPLDGIDFLIRAGIATDGLPH